VILDLEVKVRASGFVSETQFPPTPIFIPDDLVTLAVGLVELDLKLLDQDFDTLVVRGGAWYLSSNAADMVFSVGCFCLTLTL